MEKISYYKNAIRKHYLEFLNRGPDEEGMKHYLNQLLENKITVEHLKKIFLNSEEYRYKRLLKLRNTELPTSKRMEIDWDDRAAFDSKFFIRTVKHQTEKEFWSSGAEECKEIIGINQQRFYLICKDIIPKKMKILEIGCGIGRLLIPMSKEFGEAIGVDVSSKMIKIGQKFTKNLPNCKLYHNDGIDLKMFDDNSFDFCFSSIVFQHIPEKMIIINYIKEVSRVLKKGKLFRFQVHGDSNASIIDGTTWNGIHFTSEEIHQIAKNTKFKILEESGEKEHYYWLTFQSIK